MRKKEIEYLQSKGTFVPPVEKTVQKFLEEFVELYGTNRWSPSTYSTNMGMLKNYIFPNIGDLKMKHINAKKMDVFFCDLKEQKRVPLPGRPDTGFVSNKQIKEMHVLLTTAFNLAVEWGDLGKNPVTKSSRPLVKKKAKKVLEPSQAKYLIANCDNSILLVCILLAFGCSMRIGEVLGLRWENVDLGNIQEDFEDAKLMVVEELQRVSLEALSKIKTRLDDIHFTFPVIKKTAKTRLVLKSPKTESSVRTVWIPAMVCKLLVMIKKEQEKNKSFLGDDYEDYGLVISRANGRPIEESRILDMLDEVLKKSDLPDVDFHSLRHTSTTFKLIITNGDIKSVQGDLGHAQAVMTTDTYAEIIDSRRKENAKLFQREFLSTDNDSQKTASEEKLDKLVAVMYAASPEKIDAVISVLENMFV